MMSKRSKFFTLFSSNYQTLSATDVDDALPTKTYRHYSTAIIISFCSALVIVCLTVGFILGRYSLAPTIDGFQPPAGATLKTWFENTTFSGQPTPESEAAWQSLVPKGRGFVTHPTLAPQGKGLSVFHELHCLHGIQIVYHTILHNLTVATNSSAGQSPFALSLGVNTDLHHIAHCFDYLRQALMCAADTNLEERDPETGHTTGWGFERMCRDYDAVVRWAEKWRNNGGQTILGSVPGEHVHT